MREFKAALADTGMKVPMATTNLFGDPVFRDGAFTSNDARVRAYALQKTMRAIDLGVELGAETYVFWGGREGVETNAAKDPQDALQLVPRRAQLPLRVRAVAGLRAASSRSSPSRTSRAATSSCRRSATCWRSSTRSTIPDMVGLNPEVAHDTMAGLDFSHGVAQALEAGKLFHIDLNGQKPGRFDQDLRFGSEDLKGAFFLVKLLEDAKWPGMRHFDSHAYRTEDEDGVWDFARGSMRTYLILKEKVARFNADAEIQGLLRELRTRGAAGRARQVHAGQPRPSSRHARSTSPAMRDAGLRLRAARSADDGAAARSAVSVAIAAVPRPRRRHQRRQGDSRRRGGRRRGDGRHAADAVARRSPVGGAGSGGVVAGDARVDPSVLRALNASRVAAIGISGQMHSSVFLDAQGAVIRPALLWCDGRTTAECARSRERVGGEERLRDCVQSGARGLHAAEGALAAQARAGSVRATGHGAAAKDFIRYRLTGVLATEPSDASATLMYDPARLRWSDEILAAVGAAAGARSRRRRIGRGARPRDARGVAG